MASNQDTADRLNGFFLEHRIKKKYLAITKGIPNPPEGTSGVVNSSLLKTKRLILDVGTIDIPIYEKTVADRQRMSLRPVLSHRDDPIRSSKYNAKVKSFRAVTHFKVRKDEELYNVHMMQMITR